MQDVTMILSIPSMVPRPDRIRQHAPDIYGNDVVTFRTTYTEKAEGMPQLLLVEQPEPESTLLPHYHASDQFQVFIDGDGRLGAHAIRPISVHYTNRYTGYGPLVAGQQGVSYYVFRPSFDVLGPGQYLFRPELRERIKAHPGPKRTFVADGIAVSGPEQLRALPTPVTRRLFEAAADLPDAGTLADSVMMGPGAAFHGPHPASGGGQVILVLAGSIQYADQELGVRSAIAVSKDEAPVSFDAGKDGAQLLVMQYPRWS